MNKEPWDRSRNCRPAAAASLSSGSRGAAAGAEPGKGGTAGHCESEPQLAATSHAAVVWCSAFPNHLPRNQTAELSCQDEHCLLQRPTPGPKFSIARRQTVSFALSNVSAPWLHRKSYKDAPAEWS